MHPSRLLVILCLVLAGPLFAQPPTGAISAADYDSLQAAVDANPGKMIFLPPGDYPISEFVSDRTIALPFYGGMTASDVRYVSDALRRALARVGAPATMAC